MTHNSSICFDKHANARRCNDIIVECEFLQRRVPRAETSDYESVSGNLPLQGRSNKAVSVVSRNFVIVRSYRQRQVRLD
jgi:hypothetical protein